MKHCDDLACSLCYNADGLFLSEGGHALPPEPEPSPELAADDASPFDDDTQ